MTVSDERKAELREVSSRHPSRSHWLGCDEVISLLDEIADLRQRVEAAEERYDGLRETRQQEVRATEQWRDRCRMLEAALRRIAHGNVLNSECPAIAKRALAAPKPPAQDGNPGMNVTCECEKGPREIIEHTDEAGASWWTLASHCSDCLNAVDDPAYEALSVIEQALLTSDVPADVWEPKLRVLRARQRVPDDD